MSWASPVKQSPRELGGMARATRPWKHEMPQTPLENTSEGGCVIGFSSFETSAKSSSPPAGSAISSDY